MLSSFEISIMVYWLENWGLAFLLSLESINQYIKLGTMNLLGSEKLLLGRYWCKNPVNQTTGEDVNKINWKTND